MNIKDIFFENELYTIINNNYENRICDLSQVNIFIGANNTGKSRFLRSIFYSDKKNKLGLSTI